MRVAIVGAGISGLSLALVLREAGVDVRVLEASDVPGGVIRSVRLPDRTLELGPQRVRHAPELSRLLARLNPEGREAWAGFRSQEDPGWDSSSGSGPRHVSRFGPDPDLDPKHPSLQVGIARHGRIHPVPGSLKEGLVSPLLSLRGKLRLALEPLVAGEVSPGGASESGSGAPPSSEAWLTRRAGREAYLALLGPLFGGLYGSDPGEMEARRALLPALRELGAERSLVLGFLARGRPGLLAHAPQVPREGMAALPHALAAALGSALSLGTPVRGLARRSGRGWILSTGEGAHAGVEEADHVVLTLPPEGAACLLAPCAPDAAARLRRLRMNPLAVVHLEVDPLPPGLGFQVALDEGGPLRGASFSGHLDGSGTTAVAFLGGMRAPDFPSRPDGEVVAETLARVKRWVGGEVRPLHAWRTRMPAWDRSFQALDGLQLPQGLHLHAGYVGRPGIIGRLREAERLASFLLRQREGIHAHEGSAASGSPVRA